MLTHVLVCGPAAVCRIANICSEERKALHPLSWPDGGHWPFKGGTLDKLIKRVQTRAKSRGITPPVSTSYLGGEVPPSKEIPLVDYVNMHANNLWQWKDGNLIHMVEKVRSSAGFKEKPKPIIFTEDDGLCDHDGLMSWTRAEPVMRDPAKTGPQGVACFFHFDKCKPEPNTKCAFGQAVAARASWGLFLGCCGFSTCPAAAHKYDSGMGFQCPPVNWHRDSSPTKTEFFDLLEVATGGRPKPPPPPPPPRPSPPPPPSPHPAPPCYPRPPPPPIGGASPPRTRTVHRPRAAPPPPPSPQPPLIFPSPNPPTPKPPPSPPPDSTASDVQASSRVEGAGIALAHGGWDSSIEVEGTELGKKLERWLESEHSGDDMMMILITLGCAGACCLCCRWVLRTCCGCCPSNTRSGLPKIDQRVVDRIKRDSSRRAHLAAKYGGVPRVDQ